MIFVVGTGRCGTRTAAQHFANRGADARHETHIELLVELAARYQYGQATIEQAATVIADWCRFGDVESNYALTGLIPPLRTAYPDADFLWVYRDPLPTVTSMVAKGWYADEDVDVWPVSYQWWDFTGDRALMMFDVNWRAFRISAHLLGEMGLREWRGLGQVGRCAWWWQWAVRRIAGDSPPDSGFVRVGSFGERENRGPGGVLSGGEARLVADIVEPAMRHIPHVVPPPLVDPNTRTHNI